MESAGEDSRRYLFILRISGNLEGSSKGVMGKEMSPIPARRLVQDKPGTARRGAGEARPAGLGPRGGQIAVAALPPL